MQLGEEVCEPGFGSGGAGDDRDDRGGTLEAEDDVGCEETQLLVLVGYGCERARPFLLGLFPHPLGPPLPRQIRLRRLYSHRKFRSKAEDAVSRALLPHTAADESPRSGRWRFLRGPNSYSSP